MTIDRAEMARRLDSRLAANRSDEPFHDEPEPAPRGQITTRGLRQDDYGRPGLDPRSWDVDGYREEERQMAAMLREATV